MHEPYYAPDPRTEYLYQHDRSLKATLGLLLAAVIITITLGV